MANVLLYVVVIKTLQPFGDPLVPDIRTSSPFTRESVRRSFSREKTIGLSPKSVPQVKTIEESTSGTDQEEETNAEIPNVTDYREVFRPNRSCKYIFINILLICIYHKRSMNIFIK